jgi:hypothetical protein
LHCTRYTGPTSTGFSFVPIGALALAFPKLQANYVTSKRRPCIVFQVVMIATGCVLVGIVWCPTHVLRPAALTAIGCNLATMSPTPCPVQGQSTRFNLWRAPSTIYKAATRTYKDTTDRRHNTTRTRLKQMALMSPAHKVKEEEEVRRIH